MKDSADTRIQARSMTCPADPLGELLAQPAHFQQHLPGVMNQPARGAEDLEPQTLGPRPQPRFGQCDPLERRQHLMCQYSESQPNLHWPIGPERATQGITRPPTRSSTHGVALRWSRFFPMPLQQLLTAPVPLVRRHCEVFCRRSIRKQLPLPFPHANRHIAQRPTFSDRIAWTNGPNARVGG